MRTRPGVRAATTWSFRGRSRRGHCSATVMPRTVVRTRASTARLDSTDPPFLTKKRSVSSSESTQVKELRAQVPEGRRSERASDARCTRYGSLPGTTWAPRRASSRRSTRDRHRAEGSSEPGRATGGTAARAAALRNRAPWGAPARCRDEPERYHRKDECQSCRRCHVLRSPRKGAAVTASSARPPRRAMTRTGGSSRGTLPAATRRLPAR